MSDTRSDQMIFLVLVGSVKERECARLLIDSLRSFGGTLSHCPVWLFEADPQRAPCDALAQTGVQTHPLTVPDGLRSYLFSEKVWACAQAEALAAPETRSLVWLNPECLIVKPPVLFDLAPAFDAAVRPVHIRNVGLPATAPLDDFWKQIYETVGVQDTQATVESFVDTQRIRAYFNTHALAVNPSTGLFRRWAECFAALVYDQAFQQRACQDQLYQIFLHQAILSALIIARLDPQRIRMLPPEYSYPYNLHQSVPPDRRAAALDDLVCVVYEERSVDPQAVDDITMSEPLRTWLAAHTSQT